MERGYKRNWEGAIMATNLQFPIAVHIIAGLGFRGDEGATSGELAMSINTSPSFVRRTLAKLSKAGLVETTKGSGGSCRLKKDPAHISQLDIYRAVDAPKAFSIHDYDPQKSCPVSCNIKGALEKALQKTQKGMEKSMSKISLKEIVTNMKRK